MHSSLSPSPHQSGSLQRQLHPGVAQLDLVLVLQLLVEMPHVQIEIPIAIEPQHLLHQRHRHPFRRGLALPPVEQTVIAKLLVTLSPAPHLPITDADDLGRLPPRDPFRHGSQNHFLYFHRPFHRGLRVREHASHVLLPSPPAKRTDHLLIRPDISCANDTASARTVRSKLKCPLFVASEMSGFKVVPSPSGSGWFWGWGCRGRGQSGVHPWAETQN